MAHRLDTLASHGPGYFANGEKNLLLMTTATRTAAHSEKNNLATANGSRDAVKGSRLPNTFCVFCTRKCEGSAQLNSESFCALKIPAIMCVKLFQQLLPTALLLNRRQTVWHLGAYVLAVTVWQTADSH